MKKGIFLGILLLISLLALLLTGYIFSIKTDRPARDIEPDSVLHKQEYKDKAARAEQWLKLLYQQNLLPSVSVAVGIRGDLVWESAIGFSDVSSGTLANQSTQYRIGSISKPVTTTAIMRMQEKQLISIDDLFGALVKDYPAENSGFSIKQLLAHQSGVRHYIDQLGENFNINEYSSTLNDTLLTDDSKDIMWSPVALANGAMNPENYALGFRVGQDDWGRYVHHGGKSVGGYSFLLIYPEQDVVIAFTSNVTPSGESFDRLQEARKMARLFIE